MTQPPFAAPPEAEAPPVPAPPARRRRRLLVIALAVVLVLLAGGGVSAWLLLRGLESGNGAPEPAAAVTTFLRAVYTEKDSGEAAGVVCPEARDTGGIARKVAEVRAYDATYDSPQFAWDPPKVEEQAGERAVVSVRLTVTTADEKTAEQRLQFTVVRKTGWWVCEVS